MPESYLEDYFALGYECYFIEYDKRVDVKKKVKVITSLFKDLIMFFNIDYNLPNHVWEDYIYDYIHDYDKADSVGILFAKRQTKDEKNKIEKKYLYEMGVKCGCIQLEYQKKVNFELIGKLLYANQAQGRRKTIRALCTSACTYTCTYGPSKKTAAGPLQDISLSHFTILTPGTGLEIQMYEKIDDIHFNIRGFLFRSDAVLVMERPVNGSMLYVFAFVSSGGGNGLDERTKGLLIPNLYKLLSVNCNAVLEQYYNELPDDPADGGLQELDDDIL